MQSLVPLLVRTFGRTGSTLLMQILGTNQRVLFEREYPFEHRYLAYAYQLASVVKLQPDANPDWNNDTVFRGGESYVSQLPYGTMKTLNKETLSEALFVAIWHEFAANMRKTTGLAAGDTGFYAEKAPHKVADIACEKLGGRSIYLLRDPRDQLVSIKSFNKKRGFNSFGWMDHDTDVTYGRKLCIRYRQFMRDILDSTSDETRLNVRYEDLIQQSENEVKRISDWLGLRLSFKAAMKDKSIRKVHMTSQSYTASVERWRGELSDDVKEIFYREIGTELSALGYSV